MRQRHRLRLVPLAADGLLLANVGHGWILRAAVLIPVATRLNGEQDEDSVHNLGLTYLLRHGSMQ